MTSFDIVIKSAIDIIIILTFIFGVTKDSKPKNAIRGTSIKFKFSQFSHRKIPK